jgi:hypothetical protein
MELLKPYEDAYMRWKIAQLNYPDQSPRPEPPWQLLIGGFKGRILILEAERRIDREIERSYGR